MKVKPNKSRDRGKTKVEPVKLEASKMELERKEWFSSKTELDPEDINPGDLLVRTGYSHVAKDEYEAARYIVLQKVVTTSRLRDEPRTSFKALLLSCDPDAYHMAHLVGTICLLSAYAFKDKASWRKVVESGLSWEDEYDRLNVNNGEE
jgi:hypothetical protein